MLKLLGATWESHTCLYITGVACKDYFVSSSWCACMCACRTKLEWWWSLPSLPLSGLDLDSFFGTGHLLRETWRGRESQSATFSYRALSSGGWAGRELCGGFLAKRRPICLPIWRGANLNFHTATYGGSLVVRESWDWLKPVWWIFITPHDRFIAFYIRWSVWLGVVSRLIRIS